ncbi:MAG: hypothetical protein PHR96_05030 [Clostridia bacterium]|jgi:hypothetical protein|nr:hypothetical protein [Clostridia bacterium]MDD3397881.1 hypothetical protein [Clostridia bacterium]
MEDVFRPQKKPNTRLFTGFMVFVIFFTTSDLVANIAQEPIWVSLFSISSGFFVFLGTALKKRQNIEKGINARIDYINNNFSRGAVILSMLDIICSLISVFITLMALGIIFRSLFVLRLIITISKVRLVVQTVLLIIVGYLTLRLNKIKLKFKEIKMKSFFNKIWEGIVAGSKYVFVSNPQASLATIGNAFLSATIGYTASFDAIIADLPSFLLLGVDIVPIAISILLFVIVQVFGIRWAFETNSAAAERKSTSKINKQIIAEEKAKAKAIELETKAKAAEEAEAIALKAQKDKDAAEAKAKAEHEAYLLALAAKLDAEKKAAETATETKPQA